jgi:predicted DNA-binding protein with PD1-like motif
LICLGSLTQAILRFANQEEAVTLELHFEIVSLASIFSHDGSHYHIAISAEKAEPTART